MHGFRLPTLLLALCSLAFAACIEPPPAAQTDIEPPDNVGTRDTGNNISEGDMGTDVKTEPASCDDGKHNQDETDVDCGGSLCSPCNLAAVCNVDTDCTSGRCDSTCVASENCTVGDDLTLDKAYANECDVIALATGGPHTLTSTINRDITLEGTADVVYLTSLKIDSGNVTILNVTFQNQTSNTGAIQHNGGSLNLQNVNFSKCTGIEGGAIWTAGALHVIDSNFTENTAARGGAIYGAPGSSIVIEESIFDQNRISGEGFEGGAIWFEGGSLDISESSFTRNMAKNESGAVARGGAIFARQTTLSIKSSTFENNQAIGGPMGSLGGAVWVSGGTVDIIDTVFKGNSATGGKAFGGALAQDNSETTIRRSAFVNNSLMGCTAGCAGGAVRAVKTNEGSPTLYFENVTFSGNTFQTGNQAQRPPSSVGTALYVENHDVKLHSVTFKDNATNIIESVYLSGNSSHLNNSLFADQVAPIFGSNVTVSGQNISLIEVNGDNLGILTYPTPPANLLDLTTVNNTLVHPFDANNQPPTNTCTTLEGGPLTEDQTKSLRTDSCVVGAYQGTPP